MAGPAKFKLAKKLMIFVCVLFHVQCLLFSLLKFTPDKCLFNWKSNGKREWEFGNKWYQF